MKRNFLAIILISSFICVHLPLYAEEQLTQTPPVIEQAPPGITPGSQPTETNNQVSTDISSKSSEGNNIKDKDKDKDKGKAKDKAVSLLMATTSTFSGGQAYKSAESVQVEPTRGTANITIPLEVPPGRKGIQPNIVLAYTSQPVNGMLGVGWSLELGAIQRSVKRGVPKYDSSDTFVFLSAGSQQELVNIGGSEYRPKIEGAFMKIVNNGSSGWVVTDKKGTKYYFGQTSASQQNDGSRIFKWCLDRVEDLHGNYMTLTYIKDQNQIYPYRISYTGNSVTGQGFNAVVEFVYEGRSDNLISHIPNFFVKTQKRLREIYVKSVIGGNENIERKYILNYTTNQYAVRSLLDSISQHGQNDQGALPSTSFTYKSGSGYSWDSTTIPGEWFPAFFSTNVRPGTNAMQDDGVRLFDINGDGLIDIVLSNIVEGNANKYVWLNRGNGSWYRDDTMGSNFPACFMRNDRPGGNHMQDGGVRLIDINGDGLLDLVHSEYLNGNPLRDIWLNRGDGTWDGTTIPGGNFPAFFTRNDRPGSNAMQDDGIRLFDINGDGLTDIVHSALINGSPQRSVWLSRGDGSWDTSIPGSNIPAYFVRNDRPGASYNQDGGVRFMDVNADGLIDIVHSEYITTSGPQRDIWLSRGDGSWDSSTIPGEWFPAFFTRNDRPGASTMQDDGVRLFDINGDGLTDIVLSNLISGSSNRYIWLSEGDGTWYRDVIAGSSFPAYFMRNDRPNADYLQDGGVRIADINGDGLEDLVHSEYDGYVSGPMRDIWLNIGEIPTDLFTSLNNGIGGVTTVSYTPSTEYTNTFLPFVVQTVSTLNTADGLGNSYNTNYTYAQGYYDAGDREFRGFGWAKVSDAEGNYTESEFLQDDIYKGRLSQQRVYNSSGSLYNKMVNQWSAQNLYTDVNFVYLSQSDTYIYEGDSSGKRTQAQYFYEESPQYGNLTRSVELGEVALDTGNDVGADKRTSQIEYVKNSSLWLLGLPKRSLVLDNYNSTVKKSEFYYDGHTGLDDLPVKGDLTKQVDWLDGGTGPESTFTYDQYGNVLTATDANNHTTTRVYDSTYHIFPVTITNALNHQVATQYYGVEGVSLNDGAGLRGLWGQVKSVTDPNNQTSYSAYDGFGRITASIAPLDSITYPTLSIEYDLSSAPIKIVTKQRETSGQSGTLDTYKFYDGIGRLVEVKTESGDPNQQIISGITEYNSRGLPAKKYLPYFTPATSGFTAPSYTGPFSSLSYDCLGRVVTATNPDNTYSSIAYDDWKITNADENGHKAVSYFDAYGRLIKKEEYTGADGRSPHYPASSFTLYATTQYTYDTLGNLTQTQDNDSNTATITYDTLGRKISMNDPDMGSWQYVYDAVGNLIQQTDNKNQVIEFAYDALNRLSQKSYPGSSYSSVNYTYDDPAVDYSIGRLTKSTYAIDGNTQFFYDQLGREIQSVKKVDNIDYTVSRSYDAANRLVSLTYPDETQISYTYNPSGQIENIASGVNTYVSDIDYSATGQITQIVYGNGVTTTYTYDQNTLRLTHLVSADSQSNTIQDLTYQFDSAGNVLSITDNVNSASQAFTYDSLNRLATANGTYYGSKTYAYDAIGNLTLKDGVTYTYGEGAAGPHAVTSGSDGSTFSYDANGNMSGLTKSGVTQTYTFDWENRLMGVVKDGQTSAEFEYDGDSGRTKKTGYSYGEGGGYTLLNADTRRDLRPSALDLRPSALTNKKSQLRYVFDFLSSFIDTKAEAAEVPFQLASVVTTMGATTTTTPTTYIGSLFEKTNEVFTKHIFVGPNRICSIASSGLTNYIHSDHLGSSNLITDSNSSVVQRLEYAPYGTVALNEGQNATDYKFTGKELDEETDLYYYGARYYNPLIGRFITPDSIVQAPYDPQSLNRYTYARNNPINLIDPTGHSWKKFWNSFAGAFLGAIITVLTAGAGAPLWLAGMAGGFFGGALTGGLEGGGMGALYGGLIGGALGGLGGWGFGIAQAHQMAGQYMAGMIIAGAGVAGATDSWDSFAGGLAGGIAGATVGHGINSYFDDGISSQTTTNTDPAGQKSPDKNWRMLGIGTTDAKAQAAADANYSTVFYTRSRGIASDFVRAGMQKVFGNSLASRQFASYLRGAAGVNIYTHSEGTLTLSGAIKALSVDSAKVSGLHINFNGPVIARSTATNLANSIGATSEYHLNWADPIGVFTTVNPVQQTIYGVLGTVTFTHFHSTEAYAN